MDIEDTLQSPISWDELWMKIAKEVANKSKDPSTKVGCVIVSPDNSRITVGYNGFPKSIPDIREWWENRDKSNKSLCKYDIGLHAEENAVLQTKADLSGWTLYCTHRPCLHCTRIILASKISAVYYLFDQTNMDLQIEKSDKLFEIAGVKCQKFTQNLQ